MVASLSLVRFRFWGESLNWLRAPAGHHLRWGWDSHASNFSYVSGILENSKSYGWSDGPSPGSKKYEPHCPSFSLVEPGSGSAWERYFLIRVRAWRSFLFEGWPCQTVKYKKERGCDSTQNGAKSMQDGTKINVMSRAIPVNGSPLPRMVMVNGQHSRPAPHGQGGDTTPIWQADSPSITHVHNGQTYNLLIIMVCNKNNIL